LRILIIIFIFLSSLSSQSIKDISSFVGIRSNQLMGYGLVVGLAKTGDKNQMSKKSLKNLLEKSKMRLELNEIETKNIAAVMATASLPAFAKQGDRINVQISSIGDATSLEGGQLLMTQLKGIDNKVYVIAQGKVNTRKAMDIVRDADPTNGTVYRGGIVENEIIYDLASQKKFELTLEKSNATVASIVESSINKHFGENIAFAKDIKNIVIKKPKSISSVTFISIIENIELDIVVPKEIIIDLVSKTILIGGDIKITPATIATRDFTFRIKKYPPTAAQFDDLTNLGQDIGENVKIDLTNTMINTKEQPTVSNLVRAMKVMKIDIGEIVSALQKLKELGAIKAKIRVR
jgi:flagellar P-ring protein FlgI